MGNSLGDGRVAGVLAGLFERAERDGDVGAGLPGEYRTRTGRQGLGAQERADLLQDIYMPVSPDVGRFLYALVRAGRPETVVEFGTSFGISTIHLAAAVTDNGTGRVVTTELSERKATAALNSLEQAGLAGVVTILRGDALETLAGVSGPVGFVLLDGWKGLYLPVLRLLQPMLTPGALIVADDTSFESAVGYVAHVREPGNGFVSVDFPAVGGVEVSCWTGP
jgi:predicted O-methyltransferase YrrM